MKGSKYAKAMNALQAGLRPMLFERGIRVRGRNFNRTTDDGLTHVITLQMGRFDQWLYGQFTVNVGVYVPEVSKYQFHGEVDGFVTEAHCCVRTSLGELGPEKDDVWWDVSTSDDLLAEIQTRLRRHALPFLNRLKTRDDIIKKVKAARSERHFLTPSPIVHALILHRRGKKREVQKLLAAHAKDAEATHRGHAAYVRSLAKRLGRLADQKSSTNRSRRRAGQRDD